MKFDILVTGADGFIGSSLAKALEGNNLFLMNRSKKLVKSFSGIWINQDLSKPLDLSKLPARLDVIIHEAAMVGSKQVNNEELRKVNVDATRNLLEYAKKVGVRKFLFASTAAVYGSGNEPFHEDDSLSPESYYAVSKLNAEKVVNNFSYNFVTIIFRYFYPYGPNQSKERLIPRIINHVARGLPVDIYNPPRNNPRTDPIYIDDLVRATIKSLELTNSEIINLAGPEVVSVKDIAKIVGGILGKKPKFTELKDPSKSNHIVDVTKMNRLLTLSKVGMREGVEKVLGSLKI